VKTAVDRAEAEHFPPGRGIGWSRPGDFILVRGTSWRSRVISLYERLRFHRPGERHCAHWSHAALVVGTNGVIVEAGTAGVVVQRIDKYRDADYLYVAIRAEPTQRWRAVRFAASRVGCSYSRLTIAALTASTLTRGRIRLNDSERDSCGSLVARALACTGETFERLPAEMLPADLAKHFAVFPPDPARQCWGNPIRRGGNGDHGRTHETPDQRALPSA
jgi:hypothetical protein